MTKIQVDEGDLRILIDYCKTRIKKDEGITDGWRRSLMSIVVGIEEKYFD